MNIPDSEITASANVCAELGTRAMDMQASAIAAPLLTAAQILRYLADNPDVLPE